MHATKRVKNAKGKTNKNVQKFKITLHTYKVNHNTSIFYYSFLQNNIIICG